MKKCLAALVLALFALPAALWAGPRLRAESIPPFRADMSISENQTGMALRGKMFADGLRIRFELSDAESGEKMVQIIDLEKKTVSMLDATQKIYMETKLQEGQGEEGSFIGDLLGVDVCEGYANETKETGVSLHGRSTTKYTCTGAKEGQPEGDFSAWIDDELLLPILIETGEGNRSEFTNIKPGAQPDDLFTVPAGYKKFSF